MNKETLKKFILDITPYFDLVYGYNKWWLTGSAFLLLKGYIDRDIHDIDINIAFDYYHYPPEYCGHYNDKEYDRLVKQLHIVESDKSSSIIIDVEKDLPVLCSNYNCLKTEYCINIDVFFNPYFNYWVIPHRNCCDLDLGILEFIVDYKKLLIKNKVDGYEKHQKDLDLIQIRYPKLNMGQSHVNFLYYDRFL